MTTSYVQFFHRPRVSKFGYGGNSSHGSTFTEAETEFLRHIFDIFHLRSLLRHIFHLQSSTVEVEDRNPFKQHSIMRRRRNQLRRGRGRRGYGLRSYVLGGTARVYEPTVHWGSRESREDTILRQRGCDQSITHQHSIREFLNSSSRNL